MSVTFWAAFERHASTLDIALDFYLDNAFIYGRGGNEFSAGFHWARCKDAESEGLYKTLSKDAHAYYGLNPPPIPERKVPRLTVRKPPA